MGDIQRIVIDWTGLTGLPGVSVFYGEPASTANADLKTFFTAIQSLLPAGLSWTVPAGGDMIEDSNGALSGTWSNPAGGGTVAASGAAAHAAGVGAYVNWRTAAVVGGRRLMGRTFIAPLMNSAYDNSGTIVTGNLATLQTAASALVTAAQTVVWHRPTTSGGTDGSSANPTVAQVPDQVTSLRTRRR